MTEQLSIPLQPWPPVDVRSPSTLVIASISSGDDSAAASAWLHEQHIEHERVFADTQWEHPLVYEHLRGPLTEKLGPITEVRGNLGFEELVRKKGLFPSRVMRFCTQFLKVFPLAAHTAKRAEETCREVVNVVGIRRQESAARSKMNEWEWSDTFDCWTWRPLINWTKAERDAFLVKHGIPHNPLYGLGATRVGCWPCIHARKSELALVAKVDPERIDLIERIEVDLNAIGAAKDAAKGRDWVPRSMFGYHGGNNKHIPLTIRETIEWARSGRGEFQPPNESDGCARFGLCSVNGEDEK